jgi:hypothetical protein
MQIDFQTVAPPVAAEHLAANIKALSDKDQSFAASLLRSRVDGKTSAKQWVWIRTLAARATNPAPAPVTMTVKGVFAAFQTAAANLKKPKVIIADNGVTLRLSVLGKGSKNCGDIAVTDTNPVWEDRRYFGRITHDGIFIASPKEDASRFAVWDTLMAFGDNPAGTAAAYGKATGSCCFCSRELTDTTSVELGYGPICAKNWGLPH